MTTPLISIIIPTYNRAHLIGETLDSFLAQTYSNWECIVVDDGSTDNTIEIIREYIKKDSRFQYHKRPINKLKGPNSCRNYGFEVSKGEYIQWFDSDDIMRSDLLERQFQSFYKNIDCSVCKVAYYDFENDLVLKENRIFSYDLIEDYLTGKITFYISGPLWKRTFLEKQSELFDEKISNLDDWDFNLRMLYQKPAIVYINEPLIQYRIHENSLSDEINKLNFDEIQSEFYTREKHLKLIVINKQANIRVLQNYIKVRYKFLLREAIVKKHKSKFPLLIKLLNKQIMGFDIKSSCKTIVGFLVFSILGKGYKLLK